MQDKNNPPKKRTPLDRAAGTLEKAGDEEIRELLEQHPSLADKFSIAIQTEYSGPLPHPEMLRQYGDINQSYADEIVKAFVSEREHRHKMDELIISGEKRLSERGQAFTIGIVVLVLICACYLAYIGADGAAITAIVASITTVSGLLIGGWKRKGE